MRLWGSRAVDRVEPNVERVGAVPREFVNHRRHLAFAFQIAVGGRTQGFQRRAVRCHVVPGVVGPFQHKPRKAHIDRLDQFWIGLRVGHGGENVNVFHTRCRAIDETAELARVVSYQPTRDFRPIRNDEVTVRV